MGRAGWQYAHTRLDQAASMLTLDQVLSRLVTPASAGRS
jgi:hypothetical protein